MAGEINWPKVKNAGIDFALVRISYGLNYMDKTYDYNMTQAELAGVPVGTYVFSTATNTETALKEAKLAISKMDGYKVSYPVVYDLEYSGMQKLSSTEISRLALTFCNEVRKEDITLWCTVIHTGMILMWTGVFYPVWMCGLPDTGIRFRLRMQTAIPIQYGRLQTEILHLD